MIPSEVLGSQDSDIGPAIWAGALHVAPPLTEEMNPASSLQVDEEQDAFG
jgi:hypothetical protein